LLNLGLIFCYSFKLSVLFDQYVPVVLLIIPLGYLFTDTLVSANVLKLVELGHVVDKGFNDFLQVEVSPQLASRSYLLPTSWALLFIYAVIIFNAASAELVQALLYVERVNEYVTTH